MFGLLGENALLKRPPSLTISIGHVQANNRRWRKDRVTFKPTTGDEEGLKTYRKHQQNNGNLRGVMSRFICTAFCALLSLMLSASSALCMFNPVITPKKRTPSKQESKISDDEKARLSALLEELQSDLQSAQEHLPRDRYDPASIIKLAGTEPEKIFVWLRDSTVWVPYRGSLRGVSGVLMDRTGNSLDRALLLSDLLQRAGHKVRLARATLTKAQADKVCAGFRAHGNDEYTELLNAPPVIPETNDGDETGGFTPVSGKPAIDVSEIKEVKEQLLKEYERQHEQALHRIEEQKSAVLDAVGGTEAFPGTADTDAMLDHWWVQCMIDDTWVDLDPMLPGAQPGQAIAEADSTLPVEDLPDEMLHTVNVRIVIELWDGNSFEEKTVLDHKLLPAELLSDTVLLYHWPVSFPTQVDLASEGDPSQSLLKFVENEDQWQPLLVIDKRVIPGTAFNMAGAIVDLPRDGSPAQIGRAISTGFGGFGGIAGGGDKEAEKTFLTAEWIEFEIHVPSASSKVLRHEVFDLVGPSERASPKSAVPIPKKNERRERGLALFGMTRILTAPCNLDSSFVNRCTGERLETRLGELLDLLKQDDVDRDTFRAEFLNVMASFLDPLHSWGIARRVLDQQALNAAPVSVAIATCTTRYRPDEERTLSLSHIFDIVADEVAIAGKQGKDACQARLYQGIIDTIAEAQIIGGRTDCDNTSTLMALSKKQGILWQLYEPDDLAPIRSMGLPPDVFTRVADDLRPGFAVVMPSEPLLFDGEKRTGWWLVNMNTGTTIGVMDTGYHQAATEYSEQQEKTAIAHLRFLHKTFNPLGPHPSTWPSNMSFAEFLELVGWQKWAAGSDYSMNALLRLYEIARALGAFAAL